MPVDPLEVRAEPRRVFIGASSVEQSVIFTLEIVRRPPGEAYRVSVDPSCAKALEEHGFHLPSLPMEIPGSEGSEPCRVEIEVRSAPVQPDACEAKGQGMKRCPDAPALAVRLVFENPRAEPDERRAKRRCGHVDVELVLSPTYAPLSKVLGEEYRALGGEGERCCWTEFVDAVLGSNLSEKEKLTRLHCIAHTPEHDGLSALCLSGGGIRSATFNLGVVQALAQSGLLSRFDYLSSVSGGGYIASWLSAWIRHSGRDAVLRELARKRYDPCEPEPSQVRHLRRFSNYLTPKLGVFSADTWTLIAIYLRNLVLNWLVIVPVLAAVLMLPVIAASVWWGTVAAGTLFAAAAICKLIALTAMNTLRANAEPPGSFAWWLRGEPRFLLFGLFPLLGAVGLLAAAVLNAKLGVPASLMDLDVLGMLGIDVAGPVAWLATMLPVSLDHGTLQIACTAAIWSVAVPLLALWISKAVQRFYYRRSRTYLRGDTVGVLAAGIVVASIYAAMFGSDWLSRLVYERIWYVVLAPALVLAPFLFGKTLFVGLVSITERWGRPGDRADAEREWWARWSAWIVIAMLSWTVLAGLALLGPPLLDELWKRLAAYGAGGALAFLVTLLGRSPATKADAHVSGGVQARWREWALGLAAPAFCAVLVVVIASVSQDLLRWSEDGSERWSVERLGSTVALVAAVVLLAGGVLLGWVVNINRFSLQAMYRNRLVRAYLGASNPRRQPSVFTGFDPEDNLALCDLRDNRPLPVINMACNLVAGDNLAWQERRACSFAATPLYTGSWKLGYRETEFYGGANKGISVGTAMATSGAAANPNMGYHSSAAVGFIMTLFNARLGAWLGNPGPEGESRSMYARSGPRNAVFPLFAEAFGFTDDKHPYVCLSDGGHFDNLGVYEMVLRRVRYIFVCDVGCDPDSAFDDLGNAIRKIRIDLGIRIDFQDKIFIPPRRRENGDGAIAAKDARYCAIANIHYTDVDGGGRDGVLFYVKPALLGSETYDVVNYGRSSKDFPHETTADQWFSESQFESYRALGWRTITSVLGEEDIADFGELNKRFRYYVRRGKSFARKKKAAKERVHSPHGPGSPGPELPHSGDGAGASRNGN